MADEFATLLKHIEDVIGCSVPDDAAARVKGIFLFYFILFKPNFGNLFYLLFAFFVIARSSVNMCVQCS